MGSQDVNGWCSSGRNVDKCASRRLKSNILLNETISRVFTLIFYNVYTFAHINKFLLNQPCIITKIHESKNEVFDYLSVKTKIEVMGHVKLGRWYGPDL